MERYNCYCARWCALYTLVTRPKDSMFYFPEKHSQLPIVPPRMYPPPPPSRLPGLLVGTFKVLSWLAGGTTALLYIYYVRAPPHLIHHCPLRPRSTWPASDSYFPALRNLRSPVAHSKHIKATFSQS